MGSSKGLCWSSKITYTKFKMEE